MKKLPLGSRILTLWGQRVILDTDLAELYGVTTKRLNAQVKRNAERFPSDFMFRLTAREKAEVVAHCDHLQRLKFSTALPYAFTEHGAVMAACVLNSLKAAEASVFIMRAFIAQRGALASPQARAQRLLELEREIGGQDETLAALVAVIRNLTGMPSPKGRKIGAGGDA